MNLTQKLINSAFFSAGSKVLTRLLGLVSTLIVARLLTPQDFANVAVVSIVLYLFDTLSHAGSEQYIMQKTKVLRSDLATAWTFNLILKSGIAACLVIFSPWLLSLLGKAELSLGLQCAAVVLPLNALAHPQIMMQKRALNYHPIFLLTLMQKVAAFVVLVSLAYQLSSYWAFIIADICAAVIYCVISYGMFSGKIRFSLKKVQHQWLFAKWLMGKSLLGYLRSQIDTMLVSFYFSKAQLGHYYIARDLAMLPAHTLLGPALEPLLAAFKDNKGSSASLKKQMTLVFIVTLIILSPICIFMYQFSSLSILALFGEQWDLAGHLLKPLSWLLFYWVILLVVENALISLGRVRAVFVADLVSLLIVVVGLVVYLSAAQSLAELAWLRVLLGSLTTFALAGYLYRTIPFNLAVIFLCCGISLSFSILSASLVSPLTELTWPSFIKLLLTGSLYLIIYLSCLFFILYLGQKRPYLCDLWQLIQQTGIKPINRSSK